MSEPTSVPSAPEFFSALADRTRLRIVNLLARRPLCVSDLQRILAQPQSTVSRHLARLEAAWLVRNRRDGMRTFYALSAWNSTLTRGVLGALRRGLKTESDFSADVSALSRLLARGACHKTSQRAPRPGAAPPLGGHRARRA